MIDQNPGPAAGVFYWSRRRGTESQPESELSGVRSEMSPWRCPEWANLNGGRIKGRNETFVTACSTWLSVRYMSAGYAFWCITPTEKIYNARGYPGYTSLVSQATGIALSGRIYQGKTPKRPQVGVRYEPSANSIAARQD